MPCTSIYSEVAGRTIAAEKRLKRLNEQLSAAFYARWDAWVRWTNAGEPKHLDEEVCHHEEWADTYCEKIVNCRAVTPEGIALKARAAALLAGPTYNPDELQYEIQSMRILASLMTDIRILDGMDIKGDAIEYSAGLELPPEPPVAHPS